jgi:hypothetical protein
MGTIVQLNPPARRQPPAGEGAEAVRCDIVIFPGVRIERHGIDLAHRVRDSAGHDDFDGIGGGRPRKTS